MPGIFKEVVQMETATVPEVQSEETPSQPEFVQPEPTFPPNTVPSRGFTPDGRPRKHVMTNEHGWLSFRRGE